MMTTYGLQNVDDLTLISPHAPQSGGDQRGWTLQGILRRLQPAVPEWPVWGRYRVWEYRSGYPARCWSDQDFYELHKPPVAAALAEGQPAYEW